MAKLVAFDTNICVWGIRKVNDRNNFVSRSRQLIKTLQEEGYTIIIPAPVLGELLAAVPVKEQPALHDEITKTVRVYPFDIIAAEIYAEMMYKYNNAGFQENLKQWATDGHVPRQKVKVDYMIAAIAKAQNVDYLYTEDEGLRKFASPFLSVSGVPNKMFVEPRSASTYQGSIFDMLGLEENGMPKAVIDFAKETIEEQKSPNSESYPSSPAAQS